MAWDCGSFGRRDRSVFCGIRCSKVRLRCPTWKRPKKNSVSVLHLKGSCFETGHNSMRTVKKKKTVMTSLFAVKSLDWNRTWSPQ
jgi:hypothetical protein